MPQISHIKALRTILDLGDTRKKAWDNLRIYIHLIINDTMDTSPDAVPPSHQVEAFQEVLDTITEEKQAIFDTAKKIKVLRAYVLQYVNNLRYEARKKIERSSSLHSRTSGGSMRSRAAIGSTPRASPYSTPDRQLRRGRTRQEEDVDQFDDQDEGKSRRSEARTGSRAGMTSIRIHDVDDRDDRDDVISITSSTDEPITPIGRTNARYTAPSSSRLVAPRTATPPEEHKDDLPHESPARISERKARLIEFLNNDCSRPIPHLYRSLRAYGCRSMNDIKTIARFPLPMIMNLGNRLRRKQARERADYPVVQDLEWDILVYGIWALGQRGANRSN